MVLSKATVDAVADRVDPAEHLVAGDERKRGDESAVEQVLVGAADAGAQNLQAHLTRAGLGRRNVLNGPLRAFAEHDRLHVFLLCRDFPTTGRREHTTHLITR